MFVEFDDVFNKSAQMQSFAPETLLDYFNTLAPKGTQYVFTSDGTYALQPIKGTTSLEIDGLIVDNISELRSKLGDDFSADDIVAYSYNSQKKIPFRPKSKDKIIINGKVLPLDKAVIDPRKKRKYVKGSARFFLIPNKFPPPHEITLGDGEFSMQIKMSRIPNESLHQMSFESVKEGYLRLRYDYDVAVKSLSFNVSIDLTHAKKVEDYVNVYSIYKAFYNSTVQFNNSVLGEMSFSGGKIQYIDETISFWNKVYKIEKLLSLKLNPYNKHITNKELRTVEELYQTLINKKPVRIDGSINALWFDETFIVQNYQENLNSSLVFHFLQQKEFVLLGTSIILPCFNFIFFCKFANCEKEGTKYRVDIENADQENPMFISEMVFASEDEINAFGEVNTQVYETFRLAEKIDYYFEH
jgi:hypothetical protein